MKPAAQLLFFILLISSCGQSSDNHAIDYDKVDPFESAKPDGIELPATALNSEDKAKLARAKGRTVRDCTITAFADQLNNSKGKLYVYHFWKLNCPDCLAMNKNLSRLSNEIRDTALQIELVNLDNIAQIDQLNTYIREENITSNAIRIDPSDENFEKIEDMLNVHWNEEVPALFLVNKTEGINFYYQKAFEYEELYAIIQPLTPH